MTRLFSLDILTETYSREELDLMIICCWLEEGRGNGVGPAGALLFFFFLFCLEGVLYFFRRIEGGS